MELRSDFFFFYHTINRNPLRNVGPWIFIQGGGGGARMPARTLQARNH